MAVVPELVTESRKLSPATVSEPFISATCFQPVVWAGHREDGVLCLMADSLLRDVRPCRFGNFRPCRFGRVPNSVSSVMLESTSMKGP